MGCEVLLCLANPNGPRAVAECRPPIDKLFKCLSKRHPCKFPKCPVAGDGNEAKQVDNSFDPCAMFGGDYQEAPRGFLAKPYKEGDSTADMGKYEIRTAVRKDIRAHGTTTTEKSESVMMKAVMNGAGQKPAFEEARKKSPKESVATTMIPGDTAPARYMYTTIFFGRNLSPEEPIVFIRWTIMEPSALVKP